MKQKILLALTGSVATILWEKLLKSFESSGFEVTIILTEHSKQFIDFAKFENNVWYDDNSEYRCSSFPNFTSQYFEKGYVWKPNDEVLHIRLRDEFQALVIAPCTANTIGKIKAGIADNLLTSLVLAWQDFKPIIIAPAMNTEMWVNPFVQENIETLLRIDNFTIVYPQSKVLACGQQGTGALAEIDKIVDVTTLKLQWSFPIKTCYGIPVNPHPGAFGYDRHGHKHTGIDLYSHEHEPVYPVEDGVVIRIGQFTGQAIGSPWWQDTEYVLVRGQSGVVCYGEIKPKCTLEVGDRVFSGITRQFPTLLGYIARVIKPRKEHYEIPGWRPSMLHLELYPWNITEVSDGFEDYLIDPTDFIMYSKPILKEIPPIVTYDYK